MGLEAGSPGAVPSPGIHARAAGAVKQNINLHIQNIFEEGELDPGPTIRKFRIVQTEGKRESARLVDHYNLDVILAVGYEARGIDSGLRCIDPENLERVQKFWKRSRKFGTRPEFFGTASGFRCIDPESLERVQKFWKRSRKFGTRPEFFGTASGFRCIDPENLERVQKFWKRFQKFGTGPEFFGTDPENLEPVQNSWNRPQFILDSVQAPFER